MFQMQEMGHFFTETCCLCRPAVSSFGNGRKHFSLTTDAFPNAPSSSDARIFGIKFENLFRGFALFKQLCR